MQYMPLYIHTSTNVHVVLTFLVCVFCSETNVLLVHLALYVFTTVLIKCTPCTFPYMPELPV